MAWYYSWSTSLWNPPSLSWCSGIVMATFTYLPRPHIGGLNYKGEAAKATTHRKGSRNGRAVQRLVPNDFGGIGEKSPSDSTSKEDDNTNKPGLNHVHGSTRETGTYGDPGLDRAVNVIQPRSLFLFHVLEHSSQSTAWTRQTRRAHTGGHTGKRGKKETTPKPTPSPSICPRVRLGAPCVGKPASLEDPATQPPRSRAPHSLVRFQSMIEAKQRSTYSPGCTSPFP